MFTQIVVWLQNIISQIGPFGIAIATAIESFFAPIPSEPILIITGTLLKSIPEIIIYVLFASLGSYLGTLPFYLIGRKSKTFTENFINKFGRYLFIQMSDLQKVEDMFEKRGNLIVFFGRFIPGVRSLISIPAGICNMNFKVYSIYTLCGSFLWNTFLIGSGYLIKDKFQIILNVLDKYEYYVYILIIVIVIFFLVNRLLIKFKK